MSIRSRKYLVCAAAFALAFAGMTAANGSPASVRIAGSRPSWARASNLVRRVVPDSRIDFLVFLGWRDAAGVTAVASAVSDPSSASYGRYLTAAQFRATFSPAAADVDAVRTWLSDSGLRVDAVPTSRLWVAASGRARDVERALGTDLAMFRDGDAMRRSTTGDPRVPASLAGIVQGSSGSPTSACTPGSRTASRSLRPSRTDARAARSGARSSRTTCHRPTERPSPTTCAATHPISCGARTA